MPIAAFTGVKMFKPQRFFFAAILSTLTFFVSALPAASQSYPDIVFVGQVPMTEDFCNVVSVFCNQRGSLQQTTRGGGLFIRYSDGSVRDITQAAGYGMTGFQGANAIAVRDPHVHWNGQKIIFSMVIGGSVEQYQYEDYYFQMYEVTNFGKNQTPVITKVPNQPVDYNNVMPIYGTDERILFMSDRPRNGARHLFPQLDEYESQPTIVGLYSLNPQTGDIFLLDHTPSGGFDPIIDSFGRVLYTRWDHLQRDQQADNAESRAYTSPYNFSGEGPNDSALNSFAEVFPEPRSEETAVPNLNLHEFNHFFPWQIHEDGFEHETLNHVGRHELHTYFDRSFTNDDNLTEFLGASSDAANQSRIDNFLHIQEDPNTPGLYWGVMAPEFQTHAAGQIVTITGGPAVKADQMVVTYITDPATASFTDNPTLAHSGLYRTPLPLVNGNVVVSHTTNTRREGNDGTREAPTSRYAFRLKPLVAFGAYKKAGAPLTAGIVRNVTYWDPDVMVTQNGALWELQPAEIRTRTKPARLVASVKAPEQNAFNIAGVNVESFKTYLRQNDLALIVSRDVTTRDSADRQQPFNLRVQGTNKQTLGASGQIYDIAHMQIFQGDQVRAYAQFNDESGRRVLAQPLHDGFAKNPPNPGSPQSSVKLGTDGSMAALVPARRALSWQLTNTAGTGIVRERYWLTFQPGEIRVCASCHGENSHDQAGNPPPENTPQALIDLLRYWKEAPQGRKAPCDFDGDGKTDLGVVRPGSPASLFLSLSTNGATEVRQFGDTNRDVFTGQDFDGDGKADITAVAARTEPGVTWWHQASSTSSVIGQPWGVRGDIPAFGDIDGDSKSDRTIFRPTDGTWWSLRSSLGGLAGLQWGRRGDIPVSADYDGDGWDDLAIFRPVTGTWAVLQSSKGASKNVKDIIYTGWGNKPGDNPMTGDYDGDGKADLMIYRPSTGVWWGCSSTQKFKCQKYSAMQFGLPGDLPVSGDFDGDGIIDRAVWRPSNGTWYIKRSSDRGVTVRQFGLTGDTPLCVGGATIKSKLP